jgi:putative ABC transport system permease protein
MDLRYAFRSLLRARGTTGVAVLCLALGIGATVLVFSVLDATILRPLPCPAPDRLVAVMERHPQRGLMAVRPAAYAAWRDRAWWFERSAPQLGTPIVLAGQDRHLDGLLAGEGFFETWGVAPRLGRGFIADDYQHPITADDFGQRGSVVVLSDAFWRSQFGADAGIIGRAMSLDGASYTVVGVMPPSFRVIDRSDIVVPWILTAADRAEQRFHMLPTVARLRPSITREQAQREMSAAYRVLGATLPESAEWGVDLIPPRELLLGRIPDALAMLFGAVSLVLLIACANVSNLLLARALAQRRDFAVRLALGCTRARLVRQQLAEGLLLTVAGAAGGLAIAAVGVRLLATLSIIATMPFAFQPALDARVFAFACLIAGASVLLFATIPAWSSSRTDVIEALKRPRVWTSLRARRHGVRAMLVIGEVALGVIVAVLTTMMVQSVWRLQQVNPGMRTDGVLTARLDVSAHAHPNDAAMPELYDQVLARVRVLPGVRVAAVGSYVPLTDAGRTWRFAIEGQAAEPNTDRYFAVPSVVSRDFFAALGIRRVAGRTFDTTDRATTDQVVVLSETAARRYWPHERVLGQRIRINGVPQPFWVIGIVGDVSQRTLDADPAPALYVLQDQFPVRDMTLFVRTDGDPRLLTEVMRQAIHGVDPGQPIDAVQTMDAVRRGALGEPRFRAAMLASFAGLAFLLAAVGIYGVMAQVVGERRRELGIRIALGAGRGDVLSLIAGQALILTSAGLLAGLGLSLTVAHIVRGLLFGVTPTDPASFAAAAVAFLVVSLLASSLPAHRAMRVDPMAALKQD